MARQSNWTSRARSLARRGWYVDRIAEECGVWPVRIRKALRARTVDDPVIMAERRKARGPKFKFEKQDIECIMAAVSNGSKVKDMAAQFGVHRSLITKVKMGAYGVPLAPEGVSP